MEQLIIDKMRSELFDTRLCKQDFEKYDVAQLQDTDEPFLWMVREHGTSLALIGPTQMDKMFHSESWRIALMKNPLDAIANILYWNDETAKYFYWSGYELCRIEKMNWVLYTKDFGPDFPGYVIGFHCYKLK